MMSGDNGLLFAASQLASFYQLCSKYNQQSLQFTHENWLDFSHQQHAEQSLYYMKLDKNFQPRTLKICMSMCSSHFNSYMNFRSPATRIAPYLVGLWLCVWGMFGILEFWQCDKLGIWLYPQNGHRCRVYCLVDSILDIYTRHLCRQCLPKEVLGSF